MCKHTATEQESTYTVEVDVTSTTDDSVEQI